MSEQLARSGKTGVTRAARLFARNIAGLIESDDIGVALGIRVLSFASEEASLLVGREGDQATFRVSVAETTVSAPEATL